MSFLQTLLLSAIQGVTEYLPVSSFGHLTLVEHWLKIERGTGVLPEAMLHLGTAVAILICFRADVLRILMELAGLVMDIVGNIHVWFYNRRTADRELPYTKLVTDTWRKLSVMLLLSALPTAVIGYTARRLVTKAAISPFMPGACTLITGMLLLVTDLSRTGEKKAVREASYDAAMWMGICQGLAVFPGISRGGLTLCAGLLCGLGKKYIIKFSLLMSVPACLGAFFVEIRNFASPQITAGRIVLLFLGVLISAGIGALVLPLFMKVVLKLRLRTFAFYNFFIGIIMLVTAFS